MRVRLVSIGCRLNTSEIEAMARDLTDHGHTVVGAAEAADLCIFNSCTVTATADRKSRLALRQLRRAHPEATIVATGCFAELEKHEAKRLGVDLVVGNADKDRLPTLLSHRGILPRQPSDDEAGEPRSDLRGRVGRTRAFLKVQDGCDNRCTFCIVTIARGPGRSRPSDQVVSEIRRLHDQGHLEVVLSGVHLGSFGNDLGETRGLENLVTRVLRETGVPRIRLSSLEPWDLDEGFFELFRNPRLLPHLHIPLQSGCDATLARMARRTDRIRFSALAAAARAAVPGVSLSTDVMVGFPGETDEEFTQSMQFVEEMAFSRLHIFRFSAREGTRAATMPDQVPASEAHQRSRILHSLGTRLEHAFNARFVGDTRAVLWEQREESGDDLLWSGLTDNFIRISTETAGDVDLTNTIVDTKIVASTPGGVMGEVRGLSIAKIAQTRPSRSLPVLDSR